jgi:hypothetical protein
MTGMATPASAAATAVNVRGPTPSQRINVSAGKISTTERPANSPESGIVPTMATAAALTSGRRSVRSSGSCGGGVPSVRPRRPSARPTASSATSARQTGAEIA